MPINWLFLTGILRTMREEAANAERHQREIDPNALRHYARMLEQAIDIQAADLVESSPQETGETELASHHGNDRRTRP